MEVLFFVFLKFRIEMAPPPRPPQTPNPDFSKIFYRKSGFVPEFPRLFLAFSGFFQEHSNMIAELAVAAPSLAWLLAGRVRFNDRHTDG